MADDPKFGPTNDNDDPKFGPTGDFPEGKHDNPSQPGLPDLGGLQIGITHDDSTVMINFGYPVEWIGMNPDRALELAMLLVKHVSEATGKAAPVVFGFPRRRPSDG